MEEFGSSFFSSELIFSKLRAREEDKESLFGEEFIVADNGGGKRKDEVAIGLIFVVIFGCLLREVLGEIGGFRRVA
jgi:hypothetical protein